MEKPLRFRPTAAGLQTGILSLEDRPAETERAWREFPPLRWAGDIGRPKSTAEVLATAEEGEPLLVVGQYQKGRVAALAIGSTWRWQLGGSEEPPGKYFRRFWCQLLLYLVGQDPGTRNNVWVMTDRSRYSMLGLAHEGKTVRVTAGVSDGRGTPLRDATCTLNVTGPDGETRPVALRARVDVYEALLEANRLGEYKVELTTFRGGEKIGSADTRFVVYRPDVELERPEANLDGLKSLCKATGGNFAARSGMAGLLAEILHRDVPETVHVEEQVPLWDNRYVLVLFAAFLAAEWVVRKRLGLV